MRIPVPRHGEGGVHAPSFWGGYLMFDKEKTSGQR